MWIVMGIVGIVAFAAGGIFSFLVLFTFGAVLSEVQPQVEAPASEAEPESQAEVAAAASVFMIPITLDSNRLVDVGFTQAYQEEAARLARLN